jgi:predicted Zn-ribbon and HTH transcriptional regulator
MRCPQCGSLEIETLGIIDLIDSDAEGDLVKEEAQCLKCGFRFDYDEFYRGSRPEKEIEQ